MNEVDFWDGLDTVEEEIAREPRHARALLRHVLFFTAPLAVLSYGMDHPKTGVILGVLAAGVAAHLAGSFVWLRVLRKARTALLEEGTAEAQPTLDRPPRADE